MILIALIAIALIGAAVTLLARAGALPRMQAAQRVDEIAAYAAADSSLGGGETSRRPVLFEAVASRLGSVLGRLVGAREGALRRHLMAPGGYRLSPTALLGYRALATVLLPALCWTMAPATWTAPMRITLVAVCCC